MKPLDVVSLKRAGELLGGDLPLKPHTIRRMIRDGELEGVGERQRQRVTMRSIIAYQEGKPWQKPDEAPATAPSKTLAKADGRLSTRSETENTARKFVIVGRLPKRG